MSDPHSAHSVLALHMNGSNGSTVFTDVSCIPKIITPYGNAQISTAQSKFLGSSAYFDGAGDYLVAPDSVNWAFGTGDFTIRFFAFVPDAISNGVIVDMNSFDGANDGPIVRVSGNNVLGFAFSGPHPNIQQYTINYNQWYFVEFSRKGTTTYCFVDGSLLGTNTVSTNLYSQKITIGSYCLRNNYYYKGYLQDLLIYKGVALNTANFTPPSASFDNPDPSIGLIKPKSLRRDMQDGGLYRITNVVDRLGVVGSYRVRLFDRYSGRMVREVWSDASGNYSFDYLAYRDKGYCAVAYDHTDEPRNAGIADLLTPVPM